MKGTRMIYIVVFLFASMVWLSSVVNADDVVVELPSSDGTDAFQVKDSAGTSLMSVWSNDIVGIGTTNPLAGLHVKSANPNTGLFEASGPLLGNTAKLHFVTKEDAAASPWSRAQIVAGSMGNANMEGYLTFETRPLGGSLSEAMRIDSDGNVGIGTTSPDDKLDIDLGAFGSLNASTPLGNGPGWIFNASNGHRRDLVGWDGGLYMAASTSSAAPSAQWTLLENGNVGIGTTNPSYTTHIKSTTGADATLSIESFDADNTTSDAELRFIEAGATKWLFQLDGSMDDRLEIEGRDATNLVEILQNGNVGIGTGASLLTYKLSVGAETDIF